MSDPLPLSPDSVTYAVTPPCGFVWCWIYSPHEHDIELTAAPSTETGRRLFTDNEPMDMLESDGVTPDDIIAIEQEARTLARTEVLNAIREELEAQRGWVDMGGDFRLATDEDPALVASVDEHYVMVEWTEVLAALSRLGERE